MFAFSPEHAPELAAYLLEGEDSFSKKEEILWAYQSQYNPIIRQFCETIGSDLPQSIPIEFFKHKALKTGEWEAQTIFESSGTTTQQPSRHLVRDLELYEQTTLKGFDTFYHRQPYRILALLPSYLERGNSSLVHMVKTWIETFGLPGSGFFLHNFDALRQQLHEAMEAGERILLIGVAFALLDFAEEQAFPLPGDSLVIETGGMKGRKEEIVREELHTRLKVSFAVPQIYSEYGMTELMSQAYTGAHGRFLPAPTLRVYISDIHLNRLIQPVGVAGRIHLVDLANVHSCAFIATDDLGRMYADGSFEVLGRLDMAEMRGCSLMYV
ncbi:MAG: acyl transferase [Bacteroidota bacterium]